jgi:HD-GYP domain-containing protein (c-di-GMP phosphodiesterase class II)
LIAVAEAAMYAAKAAGGGQVGAEGPMTRSLEQSAFGSLIGLVRAVDRKDRYTRRHSDLVTALAVRFARDLGLSETQVAALEIAGPLHDVGKIAVPDAILRKPGALTEEEQAIVRQHVVFGELMVQGVPHETAVRAAIAHHHERWDGGGYPHGRAGEEIPLLGRVLALADAYAAMVHDRPYRKGQPVERALAAIRAGTGTQFDPSLTEPFLATVASLAIEAAWSDGRPRPPGPSTSALGHPRAAG